ncbi:MAG: hypothetical protein JRN29_06150 [Nitrososphaerota archaeon]|nr:hypothetical protein [Nitrososphaerota archaeon]
MGKAVVSTQRTVEKATPVIQKSLEASLEAAGAAFTRTVKTIDGATAGDQARLFRAYRKILAGQIGYVDSRIAALEEKRQPSSSQQAALDTGP